MSAACEIDRCPNEMGWGEGHTSTVYQQNHGQHDANTEMLILEIGEYSFGKQLIFLFQNWFFHLEEV